MHTPANDQTDGNASQSKSVNKEAAGEKDDIASTAIYVVGVIAVIPVAGLVAWGVRTVLRRKVRIRRDLEVLLTRNFAGSGRVREQL